MNDVITSGERRAREKDALKAEILSAARNLFAQKGYDAVTMRNIASKIGYTATALYYHFPDKQSLMIDLCNRDFAALAGFLKKIGDIPDPIERIHRMGEAYVRFGLEFPHHYRFLFMTPLPDNCEKISIEKGNPDQDAYAFLHQSVKEAFDKHLFLPEIADPELIAQTLWSGVHGIVSLHLTKGKDDCVEWRGAEESLRFYMKAIMSGLLREGVAHG